MNPSDDESSDNDLEDAEDGTPDPDREYRELCERLAEGDENELQRQIEGSPELD